MALRCSSWVGVPSSTMRPERGRTMPISVLSVVLLPGTVAAEQSDNLVASHAERDVEQDVAIAIVAVDSLDLEKCAHAAATPPRYASCMRLLRWSSVGVPSASSTPSCRTVMRSASSNIAIYIVLDN